MTLFLLQLCFLIGLYLPLRSLSNTFRANVIELYNDKRKHRKHETKWHTIKKKEKKKRKAAVNLSMCLTRYSILLLVSFSAVRGYSTFLASAGSKLGRRTLLEIVRRDRDKRKQRTILVVFLYCLSRYSRLSAFEIGTKKIACDRIPQDLLPPDTINIYK